MTATQDFLARHPREEHPYLETVHDAVAAGTCAVEPPRRAVSCDELLTIYRRRAAHLVRFKTQHATQLRDDVLQFCERLAASPGATADCWIFRTPDAVQYDLVEHSSTHQLLGALRTVSKLEVSADEWERLWHG